MSTEALTLLGDRKNSHLNRREIVAIFKDAAGRVKRSEAVDAIAKQINVDKKKIFPISMKCETGRTDVHATFYVYEDENDAKSQLPRYRLLRSLPKEERKKILDEEKTAKLKAKQAAAADKGGSAGGTKKK